MISLGHLRAAPSGRRLGAWVLCCLMLTISCTALSAQTPITAPEQQTVPANPDQPQAPHTDQMQTDQQQAAPEPAQPASASSDQVGTPVLAVGLPGPPPTRAQLRQAEDAYLAGAKQLEHDHLDAAEREFVRALNLDPENRNYAIAISVARQHRLTELVQQASKATLAGDRRTAQSLLAEAQAIDPHDPIVLEHLEPISRGSASAPLPSAAAAQAPVAPGRPPATAATTPLADRAQMLADAGASGAMVIQAPALAGAIHLTPSKSVESFHLRSAAEEVIRNVASAYGIRAVVDDSVLHNELQFDLENVTYRQAMRVLMDMTHAFAVPIDGTTILFARDTGGNRGRLEPEVEETIYVPEATAEDLTSLTTMMRSVFDIRQATAQPGSGSIIVRAPEEILDPLNQTLKGLTESAGEVMVEVKLYEVDTSRTTNIGTTVPTQFSVFNVEQAADQIVSSNQSLVQQAIAQGYLSATASNLEIALALIGSGLVQSNLATNLIGVFAGGVLKTGISASTNTAFNLGLSTTDARTLDDAQVRVSEGQPAIFREGTRYPITSSTYTSGLSTAASALGNASINGVSVSSLLQKYAGGSSATIPQVSYEDLGVSLNATPVVERSGRVSLKLSLKIESLTGTTSDGNPILGNRVFASSITVADGESALMVSDMSRTESAALTGIPGLSELPGFQMPIDDNVMKSTSELVVVVTPHVVRRHSELLAGPRIAVVPRGPS